MPRRIHLAPHLTDDELHDRYRRAADLVERSHWHFLWLLAGGMTATAVTGYSAYWIGQIARRYNTDGPDSMRDRRHTMCAGRPDLPASQLPELGAAVAGPHPEGDRWCGRTVAQRLGACWLKPRPAMCVLTRWRRLSSWPACAPLLRQVATAFPQATDEHRVGLKPILHRCGDATASAPSHRSSTASRGDFAPLLWTIMS